MRVLLDECVPWPLSRYLAGHDCSSPQRSGWGGVKNGELLSLAGAEYDIFITSDQNLRYQQNLASRKIAILELSTNDWNAIKASAEEIRRTLESLVPGEFRSHRIEKFG